MQSSAQLSDCSCAAGLNPGHLSIMVKSSTATMLSPVQVRIVVVRH